MKPRKVLEKALSGSKNIRFRNVTGLVEAFGFRLARVSGSHRIFIHGHVPEPVYLQEVKGQVKPYQVKQFLKLIERYNLTLGEG